MKIGVIIIFHDNELHIEKRFLIEQINECNAIEFCLVDNNSKDKTLQLLMEIKETCSSHISVVEIKKQNSVDTAKKAGARYMFNQFNLRHIGFVDANSIQEGHTLNMLVASICRNKQSIIDTNLKVIENQKIKQTLFKSIFSVVEYLQNIKMKTNFNNLNPSV